MESGELAHNLYGVAHESIIRGCGPPWLAHELVKAHEQARGDEQVRRDDKLVRGHVLVLGLEPL